ncbi:MAG: hypothetical protein AAFX87_27010 [Bacteroidota bacterium]
MKTLKSLVFFFLMPFVVIGQLDDQSEPDPLEVNVIPPAPEAVSLGKFIDMPVNAYTGLPKIDIPLYELKSYELNLPVSISYHASGLKLEEIVSNVGAGWTLNAGGVVSRTIRGLHDEHHLGYLSTSPIGHYDVSNFFDVSSIPNTSFIVDNVQQSNVAGDFQCPDPQIGSTEYLNVLHASRGYMDLEPDMFFFTLPDGQSGKFLFDRDENMQFIPKQYTNISYQDGGEGKFTTWRIIGKDGRKYFFDLSESTTAANTCGVDSPVIDEETGAPLPRMEVSAPSTWKLTRIESPSGADWIEFDYEVETLRYTQGVSVTDYQRISGFLGDQQGSACANITSVRGLRLTTIRAKAGYSVSFVYNDDRQDLEGGAELDEVQVYFEGDLIKKHRLSHSYASGGSDYDERYLMLNSIQEYGQSNDNIPPYTFQYFSSMPFFSRSSASVDHWGYYNGAANFLKAPAMIYQGRFYDGANREANLSGSRQGVLRRITYPTGGTTEFDYELHDYSNLPLQGRYEYVFGTQTLAEIEFDITSNVNIDYSATENFSISESAEVFIRYVLPNASNGGIGATNYGNLTGPGVNQDFLVSGTSNGTLQSLSPGSYTLTGVFDPSEFTWDHTNPLADQQFKIEVIKINKAEDLVENGSLKGGGLRIKKITQNGANSFVRSYAYTKASSTVSSGKLMTYPIYAYEIDFENARMDASGTGCLKEGSGTFLARTSTSNVPLGVTQGSHVGYDLVTEHHGALDQIGAVFNGYTVYKFSNTPDQLNSPGSNSYNPIVPNKSYYYKNGLLLEKTDYDNDGNTVQKVINNYIYTGNELIGHGLKISEAKSSGCYYCPNRIFSFNTFSQPTEKIELDNSVTQVYNTNDNGFLETTVSYTYNSFDQVTQTVTNTSRDNRSLYTKIGYLGLNGRQTTERERYSYYSADGLAPFHLVKGQKVVFEGIITNDWTVYRPKEIHLATDMNTSAPEYEKRLTYHKYDDLGNILSFAKEGEPKNAFVWNYNNMLPTAQAVNATADDIAYCSFEDGPSSGNWSYSGTGSAVVASTAVTGEHVFQNASGSFNKGNLNTAQGYWITLWAKGGGSISIAGETFPLNSTWQLISKRVSGASTVNVAVSNATLDELRLFPEGAQMTTYTYDVVHGGITSMMDPNGIVTSYEYDNMHRLKYVRDHEGNILKKNEYRYALQGQ